MPQNTTAGFMLGAACGHAVLVAASLAKPIFLGAGLLWMVIMPPIGAILLAASGVCEVLVWLGRSRT